LQIVLIRPNLARSVRYDRINLDLDKPFGIHKATDRHDRIDRTRIQTVELSGLYCLLPVLDIGKNYSRSHDVVQSGASLFQRFLDDLEALLCLREDIANTDGPAVTVNGRGPANGYEVTDPDSAAEADNALHRIAIGNQLPLNRHYEPPM
jgi:hypothetical protein